MNNLVSTEYILPLAVHYPLQLFNLLSTVVELPLDLGVLLSALNVDLLPCGLRHLQSRVSLVLEDLAGHPVKLLLEARLLHSQLLSVVRVVVVESQLQETSRNVIDYLLAVFLECLEIEVYMVKRLVVGLTWLLLLDHLKVLLSYWLVWGDNRLANH